MIEKQKKLIGLMIERPEQAMQIIQDYIKLVTTVQGSCREVVRLLEEGDTEKAKSLAGLMGEGVIAASILILKGAARGFFEGAFIDRQQEGRV